MCAKLGEMSSTSVNCGNIPELPFGNHSFYQQKRVKEEYQLQPEEFTDVLDISPSFAHILNNQIISTVC